MYHALQFKNLKIDFHDPDTISYRFFKSRFHREDMLATLLSQFDGIRGSPASNVKCVPSYVAPDLASAIRRHILLSLRQRKGHFPCNYICEWATYSLPSGNI